jgi:hypothetical protein
MKGKKENVDKIREQYNVLSPVLNEKARRQWAATVAESYGWGGSAWVCEATGMSHNTLAKGKEELATCRSLVQGKERSSSRIRKEGGGRKKLKDKDSTLEDALKELLESSTRGDPMSPLCWTNKSTYTLADELLKSGHRISPRSVAALLKANDYRLQSNRKTKEGTQHPDRNAQFEYINKRSIAFMKQNQPVISVDTKKKELVGNFANKGKEYRPKGKPNEVQVHDFPDPDRGKAIPYGVFDVKQNEGWVSVGIDHDTAEFASGAIIRWWEKMGCKRYPKAKKLLIMSDGGGSNGSRCKLWKVSLQTVANKINIPVYVCHFPPGTSKWNKIEHRMFSHITQNWKGRPLVSLDVIINLIANTTTKSGLKINAELDKRKYEVGRKVTDDELSEVRIKAGKFHGDWNYSIKPMK